MCSFVGLGEDPQVLAIRAPELFGVRFAPFVFFAVESRLIIRVPVQLIASTYPDVVQGVPRV